ncbi:MAG: peptidoglycan-binding protein [Pseudomonadota bacterium]
MATRSPKTAPQQKKTPTKAATKPIKKAPSAKPPTAKAPKPKVQKPKTSRPKAAKPQTAKPQTAKPKTAKAQTAKPKPSSAKPAPKKTTAAKQTKAAKAEIDLNRLEARLKRADATTRKSVAALETIIQTLEARIASNKTTGKAQLTRQVNALRQKLESQISDVRAEIRKDLKRAFSQGGPQGGLGALEPAIAGASARMDAAELAQAEAITKVNRHLADMARAVDARLAAEARDRARDIEGVKARLAEAQSSVEARIETVERDSADALTRVGDQVSRIYEKLQGGRQDDSDAVTAKVNELALQTQAEFERFQDTLNRRLEDLEARQIAQQDALQNGTSNDDAQRLHEYLSAHLLQLQTRIEGLEQDSAVQAHESAAAYAAPYVTPPTPTPLAGTSLAYADAPNPYAAALTQADAPIDPAIDTTAETQPQPETVLNKVEDDYVQAPERESHIPAEFDPTAYQAQTAPQATAQLNPSADIVSFNPAAAYPVTAPARALEAGHPPPMPIPSAVAAPYDQAADMGTDGPSKPDFEPAPLPVAPYADPAYAEGQSDTDSSPKAVRIGDDGAAPKAKKASLFSGRTLRVGLLLVGVSALGLFTARSLLGGNPAPNAGLTANSASSPAIMDVGAPPQGVDGFAGPELEARPPLSAAGTVDPIGQYAEAAPVLIPNSGLASLEDAASGGNAIAQFQLALARIETGDYTSAADLLQQAADADLPAAQYRLAKLYEVGEGVEKNDDTARRLIEQAARGGNRIAMHDLALYYTEGRGGVEFDMATARSWFEQAAFRGIVDSQYNLALLSESASGDTPPNLKDALFWYSVAAQQGDQYAIERRDTLLQSAPQDVRAEIETRVAAFAPRPVDKAANGIFDPQPWSAPTATASAVKADVRTAQTLLAELGFAVGAPDGIMGNKTRSAITEFQRTNGLPQTGQVDPVLIERLQLAAGA